VIEKSATWGPLFGYSREEPENRLKKWASFKQLSQPGDTIWRFIAAFGISLLSLCVVAAFSLMLSCFTDNSIGPIVASMAVIILFTIIGTMDLPLFDYIKPFLSTTHMIIWRNMFDNPLDWELINNSLLILVFYIVLFLGIAIYHFNKKDITQ